MVNAAPLQLPPDTPRKNARLTFDVDLGSDGRVRDVRLVGGSGDAVIDALAREAVTRSTYRAAESGCVAVSDTYRMAYRAQDDAAPSPPQAPPTMPPAARADCVPLVVAFITPGARNAAQRGTAVVAVPLDAAAARHGEPALQKRTGNAALDEEALRIARTAQFNFMQGEGCRPQPFSYFLELTFR
ncbi:MAG: energy transducer TonB [Candidatus Velthaea sp.]